MAANANWTRWIFSSVADYLKAVAQSNGIAVLVEGLDDRCDSFMHASDRAEVRITGPFTQEISHNYYRVLVDANVLVTSRMDGKLKNRLTLHQVVGLFHEAMDRSIPIHKFGNQSRDDGSLIGCLSPRSGRNDSVRVFHFGQIDATARLRQSAVDARYLTYLEG